jgi:hypothetical protein
VPPSCVEYIPVTSLAVTADGRRAISGSDDSTLLLFDLEIVPFEPAQLGGHERDGVRRPQREMFPLTPFNDFLVENTALAWLLGFA